MKRRLTTSLAALALLAACSADSEPDASPEAGSLAGVRSWAYQIQGQHEGDAPRRLAESRYDLLVVDAVRSIKGEEDYDAAAEVARLKAGPGGGGNRIVLAYLDVGEAESYRWYWRDGWRVGDPDWIVAPDPDGWDENYPVKFWRDEWLAIVRSAVDRVIEDGFDGIYLDWLEVYSFEPVAEAAAREGLEPAQALIDFVAEISDYARGQDPGFLMVAQNAAELGEFPEYVSLFDAIAQEAIWFDGGGDPDTSEQPGDQPVESELTQEYIESLERWQALGKPVLNVEYARQTVNVRAVYRLGEEHGYLTYVTLRPLAALTDDPPPGYPR